MIPTVRRSLAPAAWTPPVQAQAAAPAEAATVCFKNDLRFELVLAGLRCDLWSTSNVQPAKCHLCHFDDNSSAASFSATERCASP